MSKHSSIAAIIVSCITVSCWVDSEAKAQIGPFNLNDSLLMESRLISSYGQGCVKTRKHDGERQNRMHLYYVSYARVWIGIQLSNITDTKKDRFAESILVTKKSLCNRSCKPKTPFGPLVTEKGIKIGDTIEKVVKVYGTPSVSIEASSDKSFSVVSEYLELKRGRILRYLGSRPNDLFFQEFYFINGMLHTMFFSISE